jgi:hypothetical protein
MECPCCTSGVCPIAQHCARRGYGYWIVSLTEAPSQVPIQCGVRNTHARTQPTRTFNADASIWTERGCAQDVHGPIHAQMYAHACVHLCLLYSCRCLGEASQHHCHCVVHPLQCSSAYARWLGTCTCDCPIRHSHPFASVSTSSCCVIQCTSTCPCCDGVTCSCSIPG